MTDNLPRAASPDQGGDPQLDGKASRWHTVAFALLTAVFFVGILWAFGLVRFPGLSDVLDRLDKAVAITFALGSAVLFVLSNGGRDFKWSQLHRRRLAIGTGLGLVLAAGVGIGFADEPDVSAQPGSTASPGATASPSPAASATSGPSPTASATAVATLPTSAAPTTPGPNPNRNPYTAGQQRLVVNDSLTGPNGSWSNLAANGACVPQADGLHISADQYYHGCVRQTVVSDFTLEVTFVFATSQVAGIFFRHNDPGQQYWVRAGKSGNLVLAKATSETESKDLRQVPRSYDLTKPHRIAVSMTGYTIKFFFDDELVATETDSAGGFASGRVGLFADGGLTPGGGGAPGGETIFSALRVWTP